jgi:hypothetical protein
MLPYRHLPHPKRGSTRVPLYMFKEITRLNWHFEYANPISLKLGNKQGQMVLNAVIHVLTLVPKTKGWVCSHA